MSCKEIERIRRKPNNIAKTNTMKRLSNECYYCHKPLGRREKTIDHKIPLSRGGEHTYSNLVVACKQCNNDKSDMTENEYYEYLNDKEIQIQEMVISQPKKIENSEIEIIDIDLIDVPYMFSVNPVRDSKLHRAIEFYNTYGIFDKPIKLISKQNRRLEDGYSRYVVAQALKVQYVPVVYKN